MAVTAPSFRFRVQGWMGRYGEPGAAKILGGNAGLRTALVPWRTQPAIWKNAILGSGGKVLKVWDGTQWVTVVSS